MTQADRKHRCAHPITPYNYGIAPATIPPLRSEPFVRTPYRQQIAVTVVGSFRG